jgi:hypothetical protein
MTCIRWTYYGEIGCVRPSITFSSQTTNLFRLDFVLNIGQKFNQIIYFSPYQSTIVPNLPEAHTDLDNFLKNPSTHKIKITVLSKKTSQENYSCYMEYIYFFPFRNRPSWARASSLSTLHDHTQTHTTLGRTPLDEWSARRRDLYLTTHNIHKRQTSMPPAGFEPAIPASERPHTHTLDRAATGICIWNIAVMYFILNYIEGKYFV